MDQPLANAAGGRPTQNAVQAHKSTKEKREETDRKNIDKRKEMQIREKEKKKHS